MKSHKTPQYSMGFMNYCSHDPGAALVRKEGDNIDYIFAEEGFLSRKKKSYQFPLRSLNYCLEYFDITIHDVDTFVFDYMDIKRTHRTSENYRLLLGDFLRSNLKVDPTKIQFIDSHHLAHAYTAFYPSGFDEATILIVDGLGSEQQTHSIFKGSSSNGIQYIAEQKGNGIGLLYSLITKALGFKIGEEGKTMGLAPYGALYAQMDDQIPSFQGDYKGLITDYSQKIQRHPSPELRMKVRNCDNPEEIYEPYFTRMAYKLQEETERCMLHLVREAVKITGIKNVCIAGGVGLNCVANNLLQSCDSVNKLYIQPASGDTGIPLGLALFGAKSLTSNWNKVMQIDSNIEKLKTPYSIDTNPLSKDVDKLVNDIFKNFDIQVNKYNAEDIALHLSQEKIISFFQDGIELGPRALGHRSFLADPRSPEMKEKMNLNIKHREGYRPFAPVVLREYFDEYFISETKDHPYMLQAPKCKDITSKNAPAIVHIDNSARVQTITKDNGKVYEVLQEFHKITDLPILINTSFNDNNEPIVFTKLDALCCFARTNADVLVLNDHYILRSEIQETDRFAEACERLQDELANETFSRALKANTHIDEDTCAEELEDFIERNANLSGHYRDTFVSERLINFLQQRKISKKLILDEYHLRVLKSFQGTLMGRVEDYFPNYEIVNDDFTCLDSIEDDVDLLLYNMSIYFHSSIGKKLFLEDIDVANFYLPKDKLVKPQLRKSSTDPNKISAMQTIMSSYEHNKNQTIDNFFQKKE